MCVCGGGGNDGLTGLGGASFDGLGVDAETHFRTSCQRELVQSVGLQAVDSVGARWVEGHMYLKGVEREIPPN